LLGRAIVLEVGQPTPSLPAMLGPVRLRPRFRSRRPPHRDKGGRYDAPHTRGRNKCPNEASSALAGHPTATRAGATRDRLLRLQARRFEPIVPTPRVGMPSATLRASSSSEIERYQAFCMILSRYPSAVLLICDRFAATAVTILAIRGSRFKSASSSSEINACQHSKGLSS
jgi:hypothetical protein